MILYRRLHLSFCPGTLANLQIPLAPSLIHRDEILSRQKKVHCGAEQALLFLARLVPVRKIKGALAQRDARRLPWSVTLNPFDLAQPANAPAIALEGSKEWPHINKKCYQ